MPSERQRKHSDVCLVAQFAQCRILLTMGWCRWCGCLSRQGEQDRCVGWLCVLTQPWKCINCNQHIATSKVAMHTASVGLLVVPTLCYATAVVSLIPAAPICMPCCVSCCVQTMCGAVRLITKGITMTGVCSIIPVANCCEPSVTS